MLPIDPAVRGPSSIEPAQALTPVGDTRQEAFHRATQALLGRQLQGDILSRLNDGTFLVRVAGATARMMLPAGSQVGDTLNMKLVATEPKATFLLGSGSAEALQQAELLSPDATLSELSQAMLADPESQLESAAATRQGRLALAQIGKTAAPLPSEQAAGAVPHDDPHTSLSPAARLIGRVLQAAQDTGAPPALVGKVPVLDSPAAEPKQIAASLQDTLAYSGLFYESHIVEWADGKRDLPELLREPQTALFAAKDEAASSPNAGTANGVAPELAQLINLQLDALEHQRAQWNGEIWPGQQMQWAVRREERDSTGRRPGQQEQPEAWSSSVQFNLPGLGPISATLHLVGERVHIQVNTRSDDTASVLRTHGPKLAEALSAAGTSLDSLSIQRHG